MFFVRQTELIRQFAYSDINDDEYAIFEMRQRKLKRELKNLPKLTLIYINNDATRD